MKRLFLFFLAVTAATAGRTQLYVWEDSSCFIIEDRMDTVHPGDSCYLVTPMNRLGGSPNDFYTTENCRTYSYAGPPSTTSNPFYFSPIVQEYVVPEGVDSIYGIAGTFSVRTKNMDSLRIVWSAYRKVKGTWFLIDTVDFSNYYTTSAFEYHAYHDYYDGLERWYYPNSYEFYFDHPYPISDTVYVGLESWKYPDLPYGMGVYYFAPCSALDRMEHIWYEYQQATDTWERLVRVQCGLAFPIVRPDRLDQRPPRGLEVTGRGDGHAALRWESADTLRQQLSVAPWDAEPDSHIVATTYGTDAMVTDLDSGIYYVARVRSERYHVCPSHDTLYWSRWSAPVRFYLGSTEPDPTVAIAATELFGHKITLTPNPATAKTTLSLAGMEGTVGVTVSDLAGRELWRRDSHPATLPLTLDVRAWSAGTYLLSITTPMGTATKKLLVR